MTAQTDLPTSLTDSDIAFMSHELDSELNSKLLFSQLFGVYTGILAVTMWNVTISKSQHIRWPMIVTIILLYILTSVDCIIALCLMVEFTSHGQDILTRFLDATIDHNILQSIGLGIMSIICTILADSAMIWRCWIVWGQHYIIIMPPSLCLVSSIVFKILDIRLLFVVGSATHDIHYPMLYASFSLATTLWCTLLIIYRILSVGQANSGVGDGLRVYWHVIEVLVESSALYSVCLIIFVACFAGNSWGQYYADVIATITRGITPTLLVGRVAAGHARSNDSWNGSIVSSLHFGQSQSQTSTQDSMFTINLDDDPEAQVEQTNEADSEHIQMHFQRIHDSDVEAQQEEFKIECNATPVVPGQ
ncbi:hypothetical protein EDD85DRAFT_981574 [Armillaria nabsnona]|nr:hypothetical protein EDD85DRAFT_981574 [Armillaria nabsnona]